MNAPGKSVTAPGSDVDAFDALPTQTAVLDSDGVIRRTNRAWREFGTENGLGDPEGAVGSNYITVCERSDDPDAEAVTEGLRGLLAGDHEAFAHEYPCHDPEGEQRWFLMRAIPFGPSPNVLVMHLDITERKLAELEVTAQNDRLETLTAVLSHDVRNPLNVAQMRAGELAETVDSEHLEPILESLDRIESILDSATVLSRGESVLNRGPIDLADCARDAWSHVETGDATLTVEEQSTVTADRDLLLHLFENLFSNAVTHGGPDVTVVVEATPGGFAVGDTGSGIDEGVSDDLFEPGVTSDGQASTGYGLVIVEKIATAHGWTVTVGSDAGGTRFEVSDVSTAEPTAD